MSHGRSGSDAAYAYAVDEVGILFLFCCYNFVKLDAKRITNYC